MLHSTADSYALLISPPLMLIGLVISGGGLTPSMTTIIRWFSLAILVISIPLFIYFIGYAGEQGGIAAFFIVIGAGFLCLIIYSILIMIQTVNRLLKEKLT